MVRLCFRQALLCGYMTVLVSTVIHAVEYSEDDIVIRFDLDSEAELDVDDFIVRAAIEEEELPASIDLDDLPHTLDLRIGFSSEGESTSRQEPMEMTLDQGLSLSTQARPFGGSVELEENKVNTIIPPQASIENQEPDEAPEDQEELCPICMVDIVDAELICKTCHKPMTCRPCLVYMLETKQPWATQCPLCRGVNRTLLRTHNLVPRQRRTVSVEIIDESDRTCDRCLQAIRREFCLIQNGDAAVAKVFALFATGGIMYLFLHFCFGVV